MAGNINVGNIYKVLVTEIRLKSPFIKITTQNIKSKKYQELAHLKHMYNTSVFSHDLIGINDMCMTRVCNDVRRCHVLEIENGDVAVLDFIDCGFIGKLPCCDLKLIPRDHFLYHAPSICKDFLLAHVIFNDEISDYRERLRKIHDFLLNQTYDMEVVGMTDSLSFVKLSSNGVTLNLIQSYPFLRDVLKIVKVDYQIQKLIGTTESTKASSKLERSIFPDSPEAEKKQKLLFKTGSEHQVLITAYVKGSHEFYVRFAPEGTQKYKEFQQSLDDVMLIPLQKKPDVGKNYLSVIEANTIDIFRVVIKEVKEDEVIVRFIDEGLEKIISTDTLFEIPVETEKVPPHVFKFSLANLKSASHLDDDELDFYFRRITFNRRLKLKINSNNECSLYDPELNCDILHMLLDYDPRSLVYAEQKLLKTGEYKIRISNVDTSKSFHAQIISKSDPSLNFYEDFLMEYSSCLLKHPSLGNVCCVKYNNCYRRGKIIQRISPVLFRVSHVDYGYSMDYTLDEINAMVDTLVRDPPCAIKCNLLGENNLNLKLNEKDEKKEFYLKVHYFDDGIYYVSLLLESDSLIHGNHEQIQDVSSVSSHSMSWSLNDQNEKNVILMASVISPYDFTVQIYESLSDMETFLDKLQETTSNIAKNPFAAVSEISVHEIYIMVNPKSSKWCRVSVYEIVNIGSEVVFSLSTIIAHPPGSFQIPNDTGIQMRDLDTGELLTVYDKKDIFIAPLEIKLKSFFGIRCSLPCIVENFHDTKASAYLSRYIGKAVSYKILASDQIVNIVELFDERDINIVYKMMSLKLVNRLLIPPTGSAFVVHVESLKKFYVHLKHETPLLELIKDYADTQYTQIPVCFVLTDMLVMARAKADKSWYRAKVLSETLNENVKVKFIDFGNEEVVKIYDIGQIPDDDLWLQNTPELAKKCNLALPPGCGLQSKEVISKFQSLANCGLKEFQYEMVTACLNCVTISLYNEYGKDILDELFSEPLEIAKSTVDISVVDSDSEQKLSLNGSIGLSTLENLCSHNFEGILDCENGDDEELIKLLMPPECD